MRRYRDSDHRLERPNQARESGMRRKGHGDSRLEDIENTVANAVRPQLRSEAHRTSTPERVYRAEHQTSHR